MYISHFASVKLCCLATLAFSLSPKHRLFPACKLVHSSSPAKLLHSLHSARRLNSLLREAGSHLPDLPSRVDLRSTIYDLQLGLLVISFAFLSYR